MIAEPLAIAARVGGAFDALQVPWLLGGSVASSLHGIPRFTQDIDLVADLHRPQIYPLVQELEAEFYLESDAIRAAVQRRASFNLIHLATMTKVDVFLAKGDPLSVAQMARRQSATLADGSMLTVTSPEDIILRKLDWYRQGDFVSERQWRDVLGVVKVRGTELDLAWMREMAIKVGLAELLDEALEGGER